MIYADSETGMTAAVVVSALIGAIAGAMASLLTVYSKYRMSIKEQEKTEYVNALQGYKNLISEMEKQAIRRERVSQNQQDVVEALQRENMECKESSSDQRNAIHFLYDIYKRLHDDMVQAGQKLSPLEPMPRMKERRREGTTADFLARQNAQNMMLMSDEEKKLARHRQDLVQGEADVHESPNVGE